MECLKKTIDTQSTKITKKADVIPPVYEFSLFQPDKVDTKIHTNSHLVADKNSPPNLIVDENCTSNHLETDDILSIYASQTLSPIQSPTTSKSFSKDLLSSQESQPIEDFELLEQHKILQEKYNRLQYQLDEEKKRNNELQQSNEELKKKEVITKRHLLSVLENIDGVTAVNNTD